jgi:negative regulator of flagellin synthesis FlgM
VTTRIKGTDTSAIDAGKARDIAAPRRGASVSGAPATAASKPSDSVSITDAARRLAALQEQLAAMPEVDAARVTELRQQVEQGKYKANPGAIADRLLQLERDFAAATQPQKQA